MGGIKKLNQNGVVQLGIVAFLVVSLAIATYLIQQRTDFFSGAEDETWTCSKDELDGECANKSEPCEGEQDGKICSGNRFAEYIECEDQDGDGECEIYHYKWSECRELNNCQTEGGEPAVCNDNDKYYCDYNKEPKKGARIFKTGGYFTDDPGDPLYGERDSNGCVYDFQEKTEPCERTDEVIGEPPEGSIHSENPKPPILDNKTDREDGESCEMRKYCDTGEGPESGVQECIGTAKEGICEAESYCGECKRGTPGGGGGTGPDGTLPETLTCDEQVSISAFLNAKLAVNLMHYYAIIKGTKEVCVFADLGLPQHLPATSLDGEEGRLLMCSGEDGSIKWRASVTSSDVPVEIEGDYSEELVKPYVQRAESLLKVSGVN